MTAPDLPRRSRQPRERIAGRPAAIRPRVVVFDCDGTLVDSEICWFRAYSTFFHRHGRLFTVVEHAALIGLSMAAVGQTLSAMLGFGAEHARRLAGEVLALVEAELAAGVSARPGAVELVRELVREGYPLAIASSAPRALVLRHLAALELTDAFRAVLGEEDTDLPKPHPDIYFRACAALGAAPAAGVAIEDSPAGAAAARAAGLFVIGVPSHPEIVLPADVTVRDLTFPQVREALGLSAVPSR